jgi:hypothetical protein
MRHASVTPFHGDCPQLPTTERVVQAGRFLGNAYRDAKRLAVLMAALVEAAQGRDVLSRETDGVWCDPLDAAGWAAANDCSESDRDRLRRRVESIARLERHVLQPPRDANELVIWRNTTSESRYLGWLNALDNSAVTDLHSQRVRLLIARAWRTLDCLARQAKLIPNTDLLQLTLANLRGELGLTDLEKQERWQSAHGLDRHGLGALLVARFRWQAIAVNAHPTALGGGAGDESAFWLLEAMRISGLYPIAKRLLSLDAAARNAAAIFPTGVKQAIERDFASDEPSALRRSLRQIASIE